MHCNSSIIIMRSYNIFIDDFSLPCCLLGSKQLVLSSIMRVRPVHISKSFNFHLMLIAALSPILQWIWTFTFIMLHTSISRSRIWRQQNQYVFARLVEGLSLLVFDCTGVVYIRSVKI